MQAKHGIFNLEFKMNKSNEEDFVFCDMGSSSIKPRWEECLARKKTVLGKASCKEEDYGEKKVMIGRSQC